MVCFGHGASGDAYQAPFATLERHFVEECGFHLLSIDGPVHGRRQRGAGGREAFVPEFEREDCAEDMLADWTLAIDTMQALEEVGNGPLGYWGLSMGTMLGLPLIGNTDRFAAAVIGLMGIFGPAHYRPILSQSAMNTTCPVLFVMQLEDEIFPRTETLQLFDLLATSDKRLHANAGTHEDVPQEEITHSIDFLSKYLTGDSLDRTLAFRN